MAIAVLAALAFSSPVLAQFAPAPRLAPLPQRPAAVPSLRAASCHNGESFEKFLGELKQRAISEGVSQRAITDASHYLN
jgi:hypothetical protein